MSAVLFRLLFPPTSGSSLSWRLALSAATPREDLLLAHAGLASKPMTHLLTFSATVFSSTSPSPEAALLFRVAWHISPARPRSRAPIPRLDKPGAAVPVRLDATREASHLKLQLVWKRV